MLETAKVALRREDLAGFAARAEPVADRLRLGPRRERPSLDGVEVALAGDGDRSGRPQLEAGQVRIALREAPPLTRDPGRRAHREEVDRYPPRGRHRSRPRRRRGGRLGPDRPRLAGARRRPPPPGGAGPGLAP